MILIGIPGTFGLQAGEDVSLDQAIDVRTVAGEPMLKINLDGKGHLRHSHRTSLTAGSAGITCF